MGPPPHCPTPRVMVFGDSLTCGYVSDGSFQRYGDTLGDFLGFPGTVVTSAFPGEKASEMLARFHKEGFPMQINRFTHVVLLAGTNDMRYYNPLDAREQVAQANLIWSHLEGLHNAIRSTGARCVAVTVPQMGPDNIGTPGSEEVRQNVNHRLRDAAARAAMGTGPPLWVADFDACLQTMPKFVRDSLFSDNVHLTAEGYDLLGEVVHAAMMKPQPGTVRTPDMGPWPVHEEANIVPSMPAPPSQGASIAAPTASSLRAPVGPASLSAPFAPSPVTVFPAPPVSAVSNATRCSSYQGMQPRQAMPMWVS